MGNLIRRRTRVHIILDGSGSMRPHAETVRKGYEDFLQTLKELRMTSPLFGCTVFDYEAHVRFENVLPVNAPPLAYDPDGGTLLYDTVGATITKLAQQKEPTDRVLVVITTDGHDTDSEEWRVEKIRQRITSLEATGDWTFLFFGDDLGVGRAMGVKPENIHAFLQLEGGIRGVFQAAAERVEHLLTAGSAQ